MSSARLSYTAVPAVPATCPPHRVSEVSAARSAAMVDMKLAEEREARARQARRDADASLLHYESLLAELNGQGRLEL